MCAASVVRSCAVIRDAFGDVVAAAVKLLAKNADPSTRTKIEKLLSVWKQRKVVPPSSGRLDRALSGATSSSAGIGAGDGDDGGGGDGDGAYDGGDMAMGAEDGSDLALIGADTRHRWFRRGDCRSHRRLRTKARAQA